MSATLAAPPVPRRRIWPYVVGIFVLAILLLVWLWNWDWFIPLVEARASAALGRKVTITHLHVHLGRKTTVTADEVAVANPDGFPATDALARIGRLTVVADVENYLRHRTIVLPEIGVDHARIAAIALANGQSNYGIKPAPGSSGSAPSAPPQIGNLRITDTQAHFVDPRFRSNFVADISTTEPSAASPSSIVVAAHGTYASQPIIGHFVGGALLTLRDTAHPYPINLHLANGATKIGMVGTVMNPLNFAGARVRLTFTGPDMSDLFPLTGVPIPKTPPFSIVSNVDYQKPRIRLTNLQGRVGSSDLEGDISEDPGANGKPDVIMDLASRRVDLTDLAGFIGAPAGKQTTPGETSAQKAVLAKDKAKKTLLPDTPISIPSIRAANVHLKYRGEHIENKYTPFDKLLVNLDLVDGRITLHPLELTVAQGGIISNIDLTPLTDKSVRANADISFHRLDLTRLMQATHSFHGRGIIGGEAKIVTTGDSFASMMGRGDGELKLALVSAGNLSALLVDIAGLEFGNAVLSALGVPNRADIKCFVTDMPLRHGILDLNVFLLDTTEGRITGTGSVNFADQTLDLALTTRSKHFSVGSLPGPINLTGPLGSPSIRPGAEVAARAGAAVGLGILLTPLGALLPTIQFGVGNDNACTQAETVERQPLAIHGKAVHARRARS